MMVPHNIRPRIRWALHVAEAIAVAVAIGALAAVLWRLTCEPAPW